MHGNRQKGGGLTKSNFQILAEREGICLKDLSEEEINNLNNRSLSDIINKDTRKILENHDATFKGGDMNVLLDILPKVQ